MPTRRRALLVLAVLLGAAAASVFAALAIGSIALTPAEVWAALRGGDGGIGAEVVRHLRLPRAIGAFACGGLLALAGALMQVLLKNPLADPYVLGISGGAGVGALSAMLMELPVMLVHGGAFSGALAAMFLVFGLAQGDSSWTRTRLLLTGVIVAAGCGAAIALILTIAPEQKLHGMLFWLMGDASQIANPWPPLLVLIFGLAVALPFARELNLIFRGEAFAAALGVSVRRLSHLVYVLASILTATAVMAAGSIGFVGLVVPHLMRLALGNDQRLLLPASALAGGSLLVVSDTLARALVAPQQLPVGVLTALIGVPVFLFLLGRSR